MKEKQHLQHLHQERILICFEIIVTLAKERNCGARNILLFLLLEKGISMKTKKYYAGNLSVFLMIETQWVKKKYCKRRKNEILATFFQQMTLHKEKQLSLEGRPRILQLLF